MPGKRGDCRLKLYRKSHSKKTIASIEFANQVRCPICDLIIHSFAVKGRHFNERAVLLKHQNSSLRCGIEFPVAPDTSSYPFENYSEAGDFEVELEEKQVLKPVILNLEELNLPYKRKAIFQLSSEEAHELSIEGNLEQLDIDSVRGDDSIFDLQRKFAHLYSTKKNPHPFGQLRSPIPGKKARWEDDVDLLSFGIECGLSDEQGKKLLDMLHSIHDRHEIQLPIKRDWRKLRQKYSNIVKSNYSLTTVKIPLPKLIFGDRLKGGYLRPAIGLKFNIKELLAEALLECNPALFLKGCNPSMEYGLINGLIDAPLWQRICKDAKEYGTIEGESVIPLILVVSSDEAISSNSTSQQPLDFAILNCLGMDFKKILVGYTPHTLPHTPAVLHRLLTQRGLVIKKDRDQILQWVQRKNMLQFIYDAFKEVTQLGSNCFKVQIGKTEGAFQAYVMVNVLILSGDGQYLDWLCGTSLKRKYMQCRMCQSSTMSRFVQSNGQNKWRDDNHMAAIGKHTEGAYIRRWLHYLNGGSLRYNTPPEDQEWFAEAKKYGVTAGYNPLYKFYTYWRGRGITSLHRSVVPDYLHVIEKGLVEKTISWTLMIISAVQSLSHKTDTIKYDNSFAVLDARISTFVHQQAFNFVR